MKHIFHIKLRAALWVMLGIACLAPAPTMAAEPEWWTQQKRACNLPSDLAFASWKGECPRSSGGTPPAPSHDDGAARRAQDAAEEADAAAERQRQAETDRIERERLADETRKKDAEFIRDRDAAANSLKGSSGGAMSQLKGLSGTDNSGLKGSAFDMGSSGLKGLGGSDQVDQKVGLQTETARAQVHGSTSKCPPSQDPSVVDLCFLANKRSAIDPRILKGLNPAERTALTTSAKNMSDDLLPFDKEIYQALADTMGADSSKMGTRWPGPSNPGFRYLNPLSEPEKVKAYWDKVNSGLHAHAEVQTKIVSAPKGADWRELSGRMDADPKFMQSIEQIKRNQDTAEGLARHQVLVKFSAFLEKQGGPDWPARIKNDKLFAARMVMERDALFRGLDQDMYSARGKALQQMTVLVKGWKAK